MEDDYRSARSDPLVRPCGRVDAEVPRDGPQLFLDRSHVPRPHAQELLLRGRQRLELRVGVCVADIRGHHQHVPFDNRRLQQLHDGALKGPVEFGLRSGQFAVGVVEARLEGYRVARRPARRGPRLRPHARRTGHECERRYTASRPVIASGSGLRRDHVQMTRRRVAVANVLDDHNEVAQELIGRQPGGDEGCSKRSHEIADEAVAVVERRKVRWPGLATDRASAVRRAAPSR